MSNEVNTTRPAVTPPIADAAAGEPTARPMHDTGAEPRPRGWITRKRLMTVAGLGLVGFVLLSWSGLGKHLWGSDAPQTPREPIVHVTPEDQPEESPEEREARWRRDVIGRWHTYYKGDRYMTVRDDGTASIEANLVDYSWFDKKVVGADQVVFEIVWTVENGSLTFDTVGGTPAYSVKVITNLHGSKKTYPIVHVTPTEFRYQSDDDDPDYIWTRIEDE